jgi:hypothetical protein
MPPQDETTRPITISKIRPVSWKIYVQGKRQVDYVGALLQQAGIDVGQPREEPGLTDPALYSIEATARADVALTEEELLAILEQDEKVQLAFGGPGGGP